MLLGIQIVPRWRTPWSTAATQLRRTATAATRANRKSPDAVTSNQRQRPPITEIKTLCVVRTSACTPRLAQRYVVVDTVGYGVGLASTLRKVGGGGGILKLSLRAEPKRGKSTISLSTFGGSSFGSGDLPLFSLSVVDDAGAEVE